MTFNLECVQYIRLTNDDYFVAGIICNDREWEEEVQTVYQETTEGEEENQ